MYKDTDLVAKPPTTAIVKERHKAGICASFAMDWLKKKLAKKVVNQSTYQELRRINKMVDRKKK